MSRLNEKPARKIIKEKVIVTRWACGRRFESSQIHLDEIEFYETAKLLTVVPGAENEEKARRSLDFGCQFDRNDHRLHISREAAIAWRLCALECARVKLEERLEGNRLDIHFVSKMKLT